MQADYYRMLYDYNCWARDRVLAAAAGMSDEEFSRPNGFTYGSIRGILIHILAAEALWLARWLGEPRIRTTENQVPSLSVLMERWVEVEGGVRDYLAGLTDGDVGKEIVSYGRDGREFRRPLWHDLAHVALHAVQHRSEAAEALSMVGRSPGDLDLGVFLGLRRSGDGSALRPML